MMSDEHQSHQLIDNDGHLHQYRWFDQIPLRQENSEDKHYKVNLLEYTEYDKNVDKLFYNSWITNLELNIKSVIEIAKGGRARFLIENKTFEFAKEFGI